MGYDIRIGKAVPVKPEPDDYRRPLGFEVEDCTLDEAPDAPGDTVKHGNLRSPSYTQWADFVDQTGLRDLFFDEDDGIMREHPGCFPIFEADWQLVKDRTDRWRVEHGKPPGWNEAQHPAERMGDVIGTFEGGGGLVFMGEPMAREGELDPVLARLEWLQWWMRWALDNAEYPAIENW